jgi:hypothetical protein
MSTIDSSEKGSWGRSPAQFYPSFTKMDYPSINPVPALITFSASPHRLRVPLLE